MGEMSGDFVPECFRKDVLVLGCGNVLFGDDGFGPAVIERLRSDGRLPADACAMDAGTGVREILFDLVLGGPRPRKIVIVDGVDAGRKPGEVFRIAAGELPANKLDDFSLHQMPTSNLLKELEEHCGVSVVIVAGQVERIPEEVSMGLSPAMAGSVPEACEIVVREASGGLEE
jgi:coenzyme F420 hydrogenase subunit delta